MAELYQRPLYAISTAELGLTAADAEPRLHKVFKRATKWNAVLLLDEADLFLAARTPKDMARSSFVTVFLRLLEYYRGVMFLTSNRAEEYNPAFTSRIHLHLHFESPNEQTRAKIWKNFLQDSKYCPEWTDDMYNQLAKDLDINGRVIKNTIRTALAVAHFEKEALSPALLKSIHEMNHKTVSIGHAEH